ncbi:MAG TPA: hypothetical protein VEK80_02965, partial [Kribbellaceae bacterium]|nr:hypothetical protein [Kribbellaceae bacterium]
AVIGIMGARRLPWTQVSHIAAERGAVVVAGHESALVVPAGADLRWLARTGLRWAIGTTRRDAEQLALALRHARHRAIASGAAELMAPPPLAVPARPVSLAALWLVLTPLLAALLYLAG